MGVVELLGLDACKDLPTDARILFCNKIARALAFGLSSVVLAQFLSIIGLEDGSIGLLMTCTLLGDAAVSLLVTLTADRLGRRFMLQLGAVLKLVGALIFAAGDSDLWLLLLLGATVGVISPSGNEVGPFQTLEQSILSEQTDPHKRTKLFNVYNLVGYLATAVGQVGAGMAVDFMTNTAGLEREVAYRIIFLAYGLLALSLAVMSYSCLSPLCECSAWRNKCQAVETSAASECQPLLTLPDKALDHFPEGAASQIPAAVPMCGRGEATHKGSDEGQDVALYRKPTLGYLGHLRWSDDGGGRAQSAAPSVRGASPDSSVDGVGVIMAAELHARNSALRLQLDHQLSLHAPSSPRKILGQLASASSSTDGSTDSSCMGGPDAVWADTCQGQLEALRRQHHQMSLPAVPAHCQHGQHPGAGDLRPFGEPPFIVDMCNSSSSSSGGSGSGGGSSSLSCSSPAPLHPQANQPHGPLMGGRSLRLILGLSVLLMVDAMGAGMIPGTFVVHYFHQTFSLSQSLLGSLLSISSTVAGFAGLLAGYLSDRMGLVRTMVLTHLPSSALLLLVPYASPLVAMSLIVIRACLGRMDVGPRQSYISGIVPAHERTAALGISNILRSLGAAMGPIVTGHMASRGLWPQVFCLSGGLMIAYNVALLVFFNTVKADHELTIIETPLLAPQGVHQLQEQQRLHKKEQAWDQLPKPGCTANDVRPVPHVPQVHDLCGLVSTQGPQSV